MPRLDQLITNKSLLNPIPIHTNIVNAKAPLCVCLLRFHAKITEPIFTAGGVVRKASVIALIISTIVFIINGNRSIIIYPNGHCRPAPGQTSYDFTIVCRMCAVTISICLYYFILHTK